MKTIIKEVFFKTNAVGVEISVINAIGERVSTFKVDFKDEWFFEIVKPFYEAKCFDLGGDVDHYRMIIVVL